MSGTRHPAAPVATLLTPPGTGAVAVIGLRGTRCIDLLREVFRPARDRPADPIPNEIIFGKLRDAAGEVDDALVVAARSGDEWHVEINTHGSWRVMQRMMWLRV